MRFVIAPLTHAEASDYVVAHVEMTILTYAHLVGPEFAAGRRAERDERTAAVHAEIDECVEANASGRPAFRRHLIARNEAGGIVGIASAGLGVEPWESEVSGDAWFPAATPWTLDHLYTVPGAHGSGLGQALLDAALPGHHEAYLWVFTENARALRFYERNGFTPDGLFANTGDTWGSRPMARLAR